MITLWTPGPEGTSSIKAISVPGSKTEGPDAPPPVVPTQRVGTTGFSAVPTGFQLYFSI